MKSLFPGDVVLPARSFLGTFRNAAVAREGDLLRMPANITSLLNLSGSNTSPSGASSNPIETDASHDDDGGDGGVMMSASRDVMSDQGVAGGRGADEALKRDDEGPVGGGGVKARVGLETLALAREACVAYLLLERFGHLKVIKLIAEQTTRFWHSVTSIDVGLIHAIR